MASKKYSFLAGVFCLLASYGFGQQGTTANPGTNPAIDSSKIPTRRMPQHQEFMAGTYDFPAKPRNMWEVGIKGGMFNISGDVNSLPDWGLGLHLRKALGYLFSLRLEYDYQQGKGQNWLASQNYSYNPAWANNGYTPSKIVGGVLVPGQQVFYNYKTVIQDLSLQGVLSLTNIRFHKAKNGFVIYAFAGIAGMIYDTKVNALNANGLPYDFSGIGAGTYKTRKDILKQLKNLMDNTYETPAETHGARRPKLFGQTFRPVGNFGAGMAFKLSNKLNIALEDKFSFTNDDLLDGQRWAEQTPGSPVLTQNFDTYNFLSLGLNINVGSKSTEPLWWVNPLDYAYSEIRNPRIMHIPKPVLPDADGDGVTDQFDQEQTPAGCPVDSHGVSRDTDGDGVPDCKDKELVTPTYCQPVDADGVGKCPCPNDSCGGKKPASTCADMIGALPPVKFSSNNANLSDDAKGMLAATAAKLRNSPGCRIAVVGYCSSTKQEQQRSWDRVNAIINYMVEKEGISADRMIFQYAQQGGDCDTVDLRAANEGEQGPTTVPAPHPQLRSTGANTGKTKVKTKTKSH